MLFYFIAAACIAGAIVFSVVGKSAGYAYIAYIFYALAAITLGYTVYTIVIFAPIAKQKIIALMKKNEFTGKMYAQYGYRTIIFAIGSFTLSVANAVINGSIGIINFSVWYFALGIYYLLLAVMRGGVLVYYRKKKRYTQTESPREMCMRAAGKYTMCGMGLILLPIALTGVIIETIVSDRAFVRSGMMIYVSAVYTVWKITMGIYNFFKARRGDELTVRAIRNVNLADAYVSVLALQTAMFHEFSPEESFGLANTFTASAAGILTGALGIYMIVKGIQRKRILKNMTDDEFENSDFNKPSVYKKVKSEED